jgi:hypothetical protein
LTGLIFRIKALVEFFLILKITHQKKMSDPTYTARRAAHLEQFPHRVFTNADLGVGDPVSAPVQAANTGFERRSPQRTPRDVFIEFVEKPGPSPRIQKLDCPFPQSPQHVHPAQTPSGFGTPRSYDSDESNDIHSLIQIKKRKTEVGADPLGNNATKARSHPEQLGAFGSPRSDDTRERDEMNVSHRMKKGSQEEDTSSQNESFSFEDSASENLYDEYENSPSHHDESGLQSFSVPNACFSCLWMDEHDLAGQPDIVASVEIFEKMMFDLFHRAGNDQASIALYEFYRTSIYEPARRSGKHLPEWSPELIRIHMEEHTKDPIFFIGNMIQSLKEKCKELSQCAYMKKLNVATGEEYTEPNTPVIREIRECVKLIKDLYKTETSDMLFSRQGKSVSERGGNLVNLLCSFKTKGSVVPPKTSRF